MRLPFTTQQAYERDLTHESLRWAVSRNRIQRVMRGVYVDGGDPPTPLERAVAVVVATNGVASGSLAGVLYELDSVTLSPPFATIPATRESRHRVRRLDVATVEVRGVQCTNGQQTLTDLARILDDIRWEHVAESALHKKLVTVDDLLAIRSKRVQRVMKLRPLGATPTESLLETLAVQLIRTQRSLPAPSRQVIVNNQWDRFVARVDLAWPAHGVFLELDGEHHKNQPVYDANRQTAVVAATGWLPGRFTWTDITRNQRSTLRRLVELFAQASNLRRAA